jgi:hypothetical protein
MPVRMLNFVKEPPPPRNSIRALKLTEEWRDFCMACEAGIKPQEYITISFPDTHHIHQQIKNPVSCFLHHAKIKVEQFKLPYDVYVRNNVVYVVGRGVIA